LVLIHNESSPIAPFKGGHSKINSISTKKLWCSKLISRGFCPEVVHFSLKDPISGRQMQIRHGKVRYFFLRLYPEFFIFTNV
jgi:hypothetical protein